MDDLTKALEGWIHQAAALLSRNYETYWPKRGQADPNERDLTTALAAVMAQDPECSLFTEVPIDGNSEERIDLVALVPELDACVLVESKNVESSKMRGQVAGDFRKMRRFSPKATLRDGRPFPRKLLRVSLMMGWTGSDTDPFGKPSYQTLVRKASEHSKGVRAGHAKIVRTRLEEPYAHQWLIWFAEEG